MLEVINGGLGVKLANSTTKSEIAYSVLAGGHALSALGSYSDW